ncbi:MAG: hypothetical protein AB7F64_01485, partial [Gammaproteobacteria bacterium]
SLIPLLIGCPASCITQNNATQLRVEKVLPAQIDSLSQFLNALIKRAEKREKRFEPSASTVRFGHLSAQLGIHRSVSDSKEETNSQSHLSEHILSP